MSDTYRSCRSFIVRALETGRDDILRFCEAERKRGFLAFEVTDMVRLCKEIMHVRENTLKGKWLASIQDAHRQAMQYLLSALRKKKVAIPGSIYAAHVVQAKGRLLTYAHDKKQRRAWEAFKEFLKRLCRPRNVTAEIRSILRHRRR